MGAPSSGAAPPPWRRTPRSTTRRCSPWPQSPCCAWLPSSRCWPCGRSASTGLDPERYPCRVRQPPSDVRLPAGTGGQQRVAAGREDGQAALSPANGPEPEVHHRWGTGRSSVVLAAQPVAHQVAAHAGLDSGAGRGGAQCPHVDSSTHDLVPVGPPNSDEATDGSTMHREQVDQAVTVEVGGDPGDPVHPVIGLAAGVETRDGSVDPPVAQDQRQAVGGLPRVTTSASPSASTSGWPRAATWSSRAGDPASR